MALALTQVERAMAAGEFGEGAAIAMRLVAGAADLLGAPSLVEIASAHIDGALYHGDSGTLFAEKLVEAGAKVQVRATLNVGALDLRGCSTNRLGAHERTMAQRMARAYLAMGCEPSWTCAPYQAGHRPAFGQDVAWGESNAVAFCNSVLGARTNRYGDFLDIACAITARAPLTGLHLPQNRKARFVFDIGLLPKETQALDYFWPVLGALYGRRAGTDVGVVTGLQIKPGEDDLKAFGAAAASSGGVGLFHVDGVTPEAPTLDACLDATFETIAVSPADFAASLRDMATVARTDRIDAVAIGSPHLSYDECLRLLALIGPRKLRLPFFACTGRHVVDKLEKSGERTALEEAGVTLVADTCVVVTPILKEIAGGVLMTNSGKFAHYAPGNTGYGVVFGSLAQCVDSAVSGRFVHD